MATKPPTRSLLQWPNNWSWTASSRRAKFSQTRPDGGLRAVRGAIQQTGDAEVPELHNALQPLVQNGVRVIGHSKVNIPQNVRKKNMKNHDLMWKNNEQPWFNGEKHTKKHWKNMI